MIFRKKGFTLLELMIVVIIIGILASLATPRFISATRKAKEAEAHSVLGSVRSSQIRYFLENDENYATDIDDLDLDITTSKYYTYEAANDAAGSSYIGRAADTTGTLNSFNIDVDGTITAE